MENTKICPSFYINTTGCNDWILKIIADDIANELTKRGLVVRKGDYANYKGEDIVYHMWWRIAVPYKKAKVNSVFITHTDDSFKEHDLCKIKDFFDSYITMSDEDACFLKELGFDQNKVFGINLAVRNNYIKPISLGIFSNCYPDNRKNENWLLDYCASHEIAKLANFVFVGHGWGKFVNQLLPYNCSFEWHCVSRKMPHEYFFQQLKLSSLDYYLYMGMDGGAMGTYDAYAMGAHLCVSDDGYHKAIPDIDFKFTNKEEFDKCMDSILQIQKRKLAFYDNNNVENYVEQLYSIWVNGCIDTNKYDLYQFKNVVEKRRSNYFPHTIARIKQTLSSFYWRFKIKFEMTHKGKCVK